ncbi:MAG: hypothetical protein ACI9YL_002081, partial [Luteibaculaceae bacterium]
YNYIPNSIDEFANAGISIGPNPFSDEIQISGSSLNVPSRVFNTAGQVFYLNWENGKAKTSQLVPGVYFVELEINGKVRYFKMVK